MPLYPPASAGSGYTPGGTDVAVTDGGTGSSTASGARTNLGLAIGTDVRAQGSGDPTRSTLGLSTTDAPQFIGINVGNATDTTITRVSAGVIAVEGVTIPTGASFLTNNEGGQDTIMAHGSMGSTETFDPTDGNVHTGTLDANCTFTLNAPVGSGAATIALYITASGTRTWTWPGSVAWPGGVTPSAPADGVLATVILTTVDGGTTWYGGIAGDGGAPAESAVTFTDITTNNASTSKHGYLKKLSNVSTDYMSGTGVWSTPSGGGGGGSLSYQQAFLSGDVSMTTANTFYDGPAVTLSAGTWLISSECLLLDPNALGGIVAWKIWDGTTVASNDQRSKTSVAEWLPLWASPVVVVIASGTPSWRISFAFNGTPTGWLIKAAGTANISGNLASHITAVQIA